MLKIHLNEIHEKIMMAITYVSNTWNCMAEFDRESHWLNLTNRFTTCHLYGKLLHTREEKLTLGI